MGDKEDDFSNHEMFSDTNIDDLSVLTDSYWEEFFKDSYTCTHAHTCNPPGPDSSHTHTCLHVHTKILPAPSENKVSTGDTADAEYTEEGTKKRRGSNCEAVRKYREKKKAEAASLEVEVASLKADNQQLWKRLHGQATLEAENARLKCLLVDIRGRIEGEIGSFPYQKSVNNRNLLNPHSSSACVMNQCNMHCDDQIDCLDPGMESKSGQSFNGCEFENVQCVANQNSGVKEHPGCGGRDVA